ncbi:TetR/AcrR family transcriptional regulator [Microlunatus sp. Y2014]|uniref:TetR/AcrR family transcriptional regulator n=1 Tax=Microlunatus sp. Y2014 TaxID=3418488 RepID=UPI003DA783A8
MSQPEEDIPRVVAVAWGVAEFPQKGPKRELSHERIVEAAIEIADADGLGAVTMSRVAQSLGFTTMALYRYISTKDELQQLMLDAAISDEDLRTGVTDDWRSGIEAWAQVLLEAYLAHPWALEIPVGVNALVMPNQLRIVDTALRLLRPLAGGADERLAVLLAAAVYVRGFAVSMVEIMRSREAINGATRAMIAEVATPARFPDVAPLLASGAYFGDTVEGADGPVDDDDFRRGLHWLLDGVATAAAADGEPEPVPPRELGPEEALVEAERALEAGVARRKQAEQQVKALYKAEAQLRKDRDAAKEFAKAAQRLR